MSRPRRAQKSNGTPGRLYRAPRVVNPPKTPFPTHCHTTTCNASKRETFRIRVVFGELSFPGRGSRGSCVQRTSEVRASGVFFVSRRIPNGLGRPGAIWGALYCFSARGTVLVLARSGGRSRADSQTLSLTGVQRFTNSPREISPANDFWISLASTLDRCSDQRVERLSKTRAS